MTVKMKIIVGAIAALVVLLLMILWATFAWFGKTPIDPLINQIGALITIVVGLISAFFGHQAATAGSSASDRSAVRDRISSLLASSQGLDRTVSGMPLSAGELPPSATPVAAAATTLQ